MLLSTSASPALSSVARALVRASSNARIASASRPAFRKARPAATAAANVGDSRTNSDIAVNVILGVAQARQAIQHQDKAGAMTHVSAAWSALDHIASMPLVPIYAELSRSSFLAPVEAAKKEAGGSAAMQTQSGASSDDAKSSATDMSNSMGNTAGSAPLVARSVTTGYSRILLDTSVARKQLDAAKAALNRGDLKSADNALKTIQQSIVLESVATRMPLVKARENLTLASAASARNDWADVKTQLSAAAKGLADYSKIAPPADVADVGVLQRQIAAYASTVDQQHNDAAANINGWWVKVANMTDKKA